MDVIHPTLWKAAQALAIDERASWLYLFAWAGMIESPQAEALAEMQELAAE
jgi:hypothetical protein